MKLHRTTAFILAGLLPALFADPLFACSVCYGDPNSSMSKGLTWGIAVLLGVVVTVLGGITTFFVYLAKKSATASIAPASASLPDSNQKV